MNKILYTFVLMVMLSLSASAQHVTRSFLVPETPKQLELTYTNKVPLNGSDGSLYIKNHSDKDLKKVHIIVSVKIRWTEMIDGTIPQNRTKTLILCDDNFDISAYEAITYTASKRGKIKGGPHKDGKTYTYDIEVTF